MNTTISEHDQKIIDRVERELLSGESFRLIERSNNSVRFCMPGLAPIDARSYGNVIMTLGRFATQSDWHLAAVREAIRKVNPYLTPCEVIAQVAGALADFVSSGYFDVIGATGPEAGRPSSHQHAITLTQAITLRLLMVEVEEGVSGSNGVPGVGWCVQALMERKNMTIPAHLMPLHVAAQKRRAEDAARYRR